MRRAGRVVAEVLAIVEDELKPGVSTAHLDRLDDALAARPDSAALRARSGILAMTEVLTQHAAYFEAGESG